VLKNEITNRRTFVVLVILAALALIVVVIWVFDKKIHRIENSVESLAVVV